MTLKIYEGTANKFDKHGTEEVSLLKRMLLFHSLLMQTLLKKKTLRDVFQIIILHLYSSTFLKTAVCFGCGSWANKDGIGSVIVELVVKTSPGVLKTSRTPQPFS